MVLTLYRRWNLTNTSLSNKNKKTKKEKTAFIKKCLIAVGILSVLGTAFVTFANSSTESTQYPKPTNYFFINDYSQVLSEDTEQFIMKQAVALQNATKAQIVVATVPNTQANSLEEYSIKLSNKWGIGNSDLNNGVLILFTTNEPHVRMEVGRGLEGCLPDGKAGRILDTWAVNAKDNERWNEAAINTWIATASVVYSEYGIAPPVDMLPVEMVSEDVSGTTMADAKLPSVVIIKNKNPLWLQIIAAFFIFWMFSFFPFVFMCLFIYFGAFTRYGSYTGRWYNSGGGGFGGGFGGGGGFSGGGGGFGGGGASR